MRLLYNPFKKKTNGLWKAVQTLRNFTWANKKAVTKLQHQMNEVELSLEGLTKPKKRGRPRKNA